MDERLQQAWAEAARTAGQDMNGHSAFAEAIVEDIRPNHLTFDLTNVFLPTRSLQPGDSLVRRVRSGFRARTMVPGTMHLADQIQIGEIYTYVLDTIIAKTRWSVVELRRGELGTIADFRREMEATLVDEIVTRLFNMIASTWNGTVSYTNYVDATATGLTDTVLTNMIETVLYYAGNVRAIIGTRAALLPIYQAAGVFEVTPTGANTNGVVTVQSILEEWRRTGRVTNYKGVPLIELPQVFKRSLGGYDTPLLPSDKVLVIGDNAGEAILYGGTESQDSTDLRVEPAEYQLALWRSFGMIVDRPENIGVIKVNSPSYAYHVA